MNMIECFRVALRGLSNNKMRTALTMLGIIMGVGVVIIVVAIGDGASKRIADTVNSLGTNLLSVSANRNRLRIGTVTSRTSVISTGSASTGQARGLTMDEFKQIAKNFHRTVEAAAPQIDGGVQVRMGSVDSNSEVIGTTVDYCRLPLCEERRANEGTILHAGRGRRQC